MEDFGLLKENTPIFADILALNNLIATEKDTHTLIHKAMEIICYSAQSDGYFFFEVSPDKYLNLTHGNINSIPDFAKKQDLKNLYRSTAISEIHKKEIKTPAEYCAIHKEIINLDNLYAHQDLDTQNFYQLDTNHNYSTVSILTIPLINRKEDIMGVAMFINAKDAHGKAINFTSDTSSLLISLLQPLICILENRQLRASYSNLLESFIETLARAIDSKSPYTGSHCQKVPIITKMIATAAIEETQGPLKNFEMDNNDWYALHIASWLHDCGKISTPDYIIDKASKLETPYNRIHEIRNRFEILRRDAHISYLQKRLADTDTQKNLQAQFIQEVKQLEDDFSFIAHCNIGDEEITDNDIKKLETISQRKFTRYFNRMLGLSWAERSAIKNPEIYRNPAQESLLQDLPHHINSINNCGELHNLKVKQGTINAEERKKINEHIVVTIDMLKTLSFPKELSNIVEYAGSHHEWVNGQGYPNKLTGQQMSIPAKIMAVADVFEALSAKDRPYKKPKKLSEILQIMQNMKNIGHLDPDIYNLFIKRKIYAEYAEQYMDKEQIDQINPEEYL